MVARWPPRSLFHQSLTLNKPGLPLSRGLSAEGVRNGSARRLLNASQSKRIGILVADSEQGKIAILVGQ